MDEGPWLRRGQVWMSKSTSQTKSGAPIPASSPSIPDKLYFRIGDVAKLCGVEAYVLRFWESEFPQLRPNKSGTGQRLYRKRDVELALRIKQLLYSDGYTIAGARQVFTAESREAKKTTQSELPLKGAAAQLPHEGNPATAERLRKARAELREILGLLATPAKPARPDAARSRPRNGNGHERGLFDS